MLNNKAYKSIWKVFGSVVIDVWCAKHNFLFRQRAGDGREANECKGKEG